MRKMRNLCSEFHVPLHKVFVFPRSRRFVQRSLFTILWIHYLWSLEGRRFLYWRSWGYNNWFSYFQLCNLVCLTVQYLFLDVNLAPISVLAILPVHFWAPRAIFNHGLVVTIIAAIWLGAIASGMSPPLTIEARARRQIDLQIPWDSFRACRP